MMRGLRAASAFVVEAELAHPARPQILDHDVGLVREPVNDFAAFRGRKIDGDAALALVPAEKAETEMAKRIALEAFDLDNFGAELREYHRAVRTRDVAGEVEHGDAIERRPFADALSVLRRCVARWLCKPLQRRAIVDGLGSGTRDFAGSVAAETPAGPSESCGREWGRRFQCASRARASAGDR